MAKSDDELKAARELLAGYLTHVPPAINSGSYNLSVDFKKAVADGRRTANARNATLLSIQTATKALHRFWEMK